MSDLVNIYYSPDYVDIEKIKKQQEAKVVEYKGGILNALNQGGKRIDYKNQGFSMATIREAMEELFNQQVKTEVEDKFTKIFTGEAGMKMINRAIQQEAKEIN